MSRRGRWGPLLLFTWVIALFAGCVAPEPHLEPPVVAPEPIALEPTIPWNATFAIAWFPQAPVAGNPFQLQARLVGGEVPASATYTWVLGSAKWSGPSLDLTLPAGEHGLRLEVHAAGTSVATSASLLVVEAPEPTPEGALGPPEDPVLRVEQDQNEVRAALEWSVTPREVRWFFGDGEMRVAPEVRHLYGAAGQYTLVAHAMYGSQRYELRADVQVDEVPLRATYQFVDDVAHFEMSWGETPRSVQWQFGDGATASGQAPQHAYADPGPWDVEVTVTGASGSESLDLVVEAPTWPIEITADVNGPVVDLAFAWPWEPDEISWMAQGQTYHEPAPQHTFTTLGIHEVTLTLQDADHVRTERAYVTIERVSLSMHVAVDAARASFSYTWGPAPDSVAWDFGDGGSSTENSPVHAYSERGNFTVTLTVREGARMERVTEEVAITEVPLVIHAVPWEVDGQATNRVDLSFAWGGRTADAVAWDLGDGTTSDQAQLRHLFRTAGEHTVRLDVVDPEGQDTATATFTIDIAEPYLFACEGKLHVEPGLNAGTDGNLHWLVLKDGFRVAFAWSTAQAEVGTVRYLQGGTWKEASETLPATQHLVVLEGLPKGGDLCFEVDGKRHVAQLVNGPTAWDEWTQTYIVNSINLVNEQSHVPTIEQGIDDYATLIWDSTDGWVRAGTNLILVNDAERHNSGWTSCYIVGVAGTPTCNTVHDVVFTFDANPQGAASTYLMGIEDPKASIWMNWYWQGAAFCSHICLDDVGNVLTHEYGHYMFDMLDYYAATDDPTGGDCWDPALQLSIMGGSRDATEYDDQHHECPNKAQFPNYEPNWERAQVHYPAFPDRADGIDPGPTGNGGAYRRVTLDMSQNLA